MPGGAVIRTGPAAGASCYAGTRLSESASSAAVKHGIDARTFPTPTICCTDGAATAIGPPSP